MTRRAPKLPVRLQLSRKAGFDLAKVSRKANGRECVKVDRSTPWGNHHVIVHEGGGLYSVAGSEPVDRAEAQARAVLFHLWDCVGKEAIIRRELAGRNLACWCEPGEPCHADTLLRLANAAAG